MTTWVQVVSSLWPNLVVIGFFKKNDIWQKIVFDSKFKDSKSETGICFYDFLKKQLSTCEKHFDKLI